MNCYCIAKLDKCNHSNRLCPASSYRLVYDTANAMQELYGMAERDKEDAMAQEALLPGSGT